MADGDHLEKSKSRHFSATVLTDRRKIWHDDAQTDPLHHVGVKIPTL